MNEEVKQQQQLADAYETEMDRLVEQVVDKQLTIPEALSLLMDYAHQHRDEFEAWNELSKDDEEEENE